MSAADAHRDHLRAHSNPLADATIPGGFSLGTPTMPGPPRLWGPEAFGTRPSLQHNALHMAKYAGELAAIAEDADHQDPSKRRRARQRAREWLNGDRAQNLVDHFTSILRDLDLFGGRSTYVDQGAYGHPAKKPTWLYAKLRRWPALNWTRVHSMQRLELGPRTKAEARALRSDPRWKAAERLSKNQRLHTPPAFRDALLALVREAA